MVPSWLYKRVAWHAPAPHVAPISPMDMDTACDTAQASESYLANLPLQRLSHTRRGWQMVKDGCGSPPPGDVSAGCRIGTPCTWTAWGGEAALAPALRYHGNLLCSETRVHLFGRWRKKEGKRILVLLILIIKHFCTLIWTITCSNVTKNKNDVLTNFVLSWVIRNLYCIQFVAIVTLSNVINPSDVGAHFIHHLHQLWNIK